MNTNNISKSVVPSILIGVVWLMSFFNSLSSSEFLSKGSFFVSIIAYYMAVPNDRPMIKRININFFIITAVLLTWLAMTVSSLMKGRGGIMDLTVFRFLITGYLLASLLCFKSIKVGVLKIFFYFIVAFFYSLLIVRGINASDLYAHSSGAYVSSMLLPYTMVILYLDYRDSSKIDILPPVLTSLLILNTSSRTGAICGLALVAVVVIIGIGKINRPVLRIIMYILFGIITFLLIKRLTPLFVNMDIYAKFEAQGVDNEDRQQIWNAYFTNFTWFDCLFGVNAYKRPELISYVKNMHNSFINLHLQVGIFSIFYFYEIIKTLLFYLRKREFYYLLLFLVLITYSFFNAAVFFTYFDFCFYLFVFNRLAINETKETTISLV